jgi:hypothetical protein
LLLLCFALGACGPAAYYAAGDIPERKASSDRLYVYGQVVESCWEGERPRAAVGCELRRMRDAVLAAEAKTEPDGSFGFWVPSREERYLLLIEEARITIPDEETADVFVMVRVPCGGATKPSDVAFSIESREGDRRVNIQPMPAGVRRTR